MPNSDHFPEIFAQLKQLLQPFAPPLVVDQDEPTAYSLNGPASPKYPQGTFVGGVYIKKNYVSYHLMSIYMFPDLLEGISDQLKKRMQGKSCFNFTSLDETLVEELSRLTAAGFQRARQAQP